MALHDTLLATFTLRVGFCCVTLMCFQLAATSFVLITTHLCVLSLKESYNLKSHYCESWSFYRSQIGNRSIYQINQNVFPHRYL
jgi:hypothetical protein